MKVKLENPRPVTAHGCPKITRWDLGAPGGLSDHSRCVTLTGPRAGLDRWEGCTNGAMGGQACPALQRHQAPSHQLPATQAGARFGEMLARLALSPILLQAPASAAPTRGPGGG